MWRHPATLNESSPSKKKWRAQKERGSPVPVVIAGFAMPRIIHNIAARTSPFSRFVTNTGHGFRLLLNGQIPGIDHTQLNSLDLKAAVLRIARIVTIPCAPNRPQLNLVFFSGADVRAEI